MRLLPRQPIQLPRGRAAAIFLCGAVAVLARPSPPAFAQTFADIGAGLPGVVWSSVAWGDYDNDGDLDILLTGSPDASTGISRVYRSSGGANPTFSDIGAGLVGLYFSSAAWGDYDNDGDLDILLAGLDGTSPLARVYRNDGGPNPTFTDIGAVLEGVHFSAAAWGDFDNDGDLDILLAGTPTLGPDITRVYRNSGGANPTFTDIEAGLEGVANGSLAWGDYDNDGDLDILLAGLDGTTPVSKVYRNGGGANPTFADIGAGLTGVGYGSVAWGDYDRDGDLDILLTGFDGTASTTRLYRNSGGPTPTFAPVTTGLPAVSYSSVAWGDCDNDGDLDLLLAGFDDAVNVSRVYVNGGGPNPVFVDLMAGLPDASPSSAAWGDYDNDGDLDILLAGQTEGPFIAGVYRSSGVPPNTPPVAPGGLSVDFCASPGFAILSWNPAADAQTAAASLTYNLRVGTTPGGNEVLSAMATPSGFRRVPALGNVNHNRTWTVGPLGSGTHYWSVQAVDAGLAGSAFASEQSFGPFAQVASSIPALTLGSAAWGDYDGDADLDLLITGTDGASGLSRVYRSSGGPGASFTFAAALTGVQQSSAAWGDFDNEADLDVLLAGSTGPGANSKVFRCSGGPNPVFSDYGAGLTGVSESSVAWGDYDNDGDLDFLLSGLGVARIARVYRNSGGVFPTFTNINAALAGVAFSSVAWGDYDGDGDLDILLTGHNGVAPISRIYRNNGGGDPTFTDIGAGLTGVYDSSVSWGDCDNDGDLDILLTGTDGASFYSKVYRNSGGANPTFTDLGAGLVGVAASSAAWGDYDSDGDLDIVLTGWTGAERVSKVYRNGGEATPTFTDIGAALPGVRNSAVAWGDYDNDGRLDLFLMGEAAGGALVSSLYRNTTCTANSPPAAPANLLAVRNGGQVTFSWTAPSDDHTPAAALTYNLRVGTTPGGPQVMSPMALASGFRRVAAIGNAQERTSWTLALPLGSYYWSVQALDGAFRGSPFPPEGTHTVDVEDAPEAPIVYGLHPVAPNPLAREAAITYALPAAGPIELAAYDIAGRRVKILASGEQEAGLRTVRWNGHDEAGRRLASGLYVIRLDAAGRRWARRLVIVN